MTKLGENCKTLCAALHKILDSDGITNDCLNQCGCIDECEAKCGSPTGCLLEDIAVAALEKAEGNGGAE